ncbi:MAG: polysaccharide biosynthesis/export family protein [Planctomycetales bacterium]|nr:polysaccharide biosynthesis/export family protein [Planctomycetales bacterium]
MKRTTLGLAILAAIIAYPGFSLRGDASRPGNVAAQDQKPTSHSPTLPCEPRLIAAPTPARRMVDYQVQPCQSLGPAAPHAICGIDCADGACCRDREARWREMRLIPWQQFAQGEYVGHARTAHVDEYRLRVDDEIDFLFRLTREEISKPYELSVGDQIEIQSYSDERLNRTAIVQPDGTITLHLLGQVRATRRTISQLRDDLEERYKRFYKIPAITVAPIQVNAKLEDLRNTVDARGGQGGQRLNVRVTPAGIIRLPAIDPIHAQGLTLDELKREIDARYAATIPGIEVTPLLAQRAPRFVYVVGEVNQSGRFQMEGPTSIMQAIALAGSFRVGANLRQVVVFRRGDDWRLMATMLDLQGALYGKRPCPADEIWLSDSDLIVVPKTPIQIADEFIEQVFTRGVYGVVPFQGITINMSKLSTL